MQNKTLILSAQTDSNTQAKAILTLTKQNSLSGKIRLYNMESLPNNIKFAIYYDQRVYSAPLKKGAGFYSFEIFEDINLSNDFYCALIHTDSGKNIALLAGGTYDKLFFNNEEPAFADKQDIATESYIDKCISCEFDEDTCHCDDCAYKHEFYNTDNQYFNQKGNTSKNMADRNEHSFKEKYFANKQTIKNLEESDFQQEQQQQNERQEQTSNFLSSISQQIEELFATYPVQEDIVKIIPNSKFIKIDSEESSYIIGVIYENDAIKYLVYGVPGRYNDSPPPELGNNFQWLPLDVDDPLSDGYFLIYQNAEDGKIVEVKVG